MAERFYAVHLARDHRQDAHLVRPEGIGRVDLRAGQERRHITTLFVISRTSRAKDTEV